VTLATVRRAAALAVALVGAALPGCAPAPAPPQGTSPMSRPAPDPVAVCINQLTQWAAEDLRGPDTQGYDYQHRGLTAEQADALRGIVAEAQGLGQDQAAQVVPERIRAACTAIAGPA
jgi:FtsP/CotA-like multicopper oxidase with cupredoxin domain